MLKTYLQRNLKILLIFLISFYFFAGSFEMFAKKYTIEGAPKNPKIVFATLFGQALSGVRYAAERFYEDTGITVSVQGMPYYSHKIWIESQFLSQAPPAMMLIDGQGQLVSTYGAQGLLVPFGKHLDEKNPFSGNNKPWKDEFKYVPLAAAMDINGNMWCIPYTSYAVAFLYNEKFTKKYGVVPPKTWEQFVENGVKVKKMGGTAYAIALRTSDAQSGWISNIILGCLMRSKIPEINLVHAPGWKFNPYDPNSTKGEKITLSEWIVAFHKGIIDPSKAPAYKVCMKMMKNFSRMWCNDYMGLTGTEVFNMFTRGNSTYYFEGTWGLNQITITQKIMKIINPEKSFTWAAFPFPPITKETTDLVTAGGVNQNTNMRGRIFIPKQKNKWIEKAALLFAQYLTTPEMCREVFKHSQLYDLPVIKGVKGKPGTGALIADNKFASILPFVHLYGYDVEARVHYETLNQEYFSGQINMDTYLKRISLNQKQSLKRLVRLYYKQLNFKFLKKELGKDYDEWVK